MNFPPILLIFRNFFAFLIKQLLTLYFLVKKKSIANHKINPALIVIIPWLSLIFIQKIGALHKLTKHYPKILNYSYKYVTQSKLELQMNFKMFNEYYSVM